MARGRVDDRRGHTVDRGAAASLRELQRRYAGRASFLLVYIREAHTAETWESSRNERDGVRVRPAANITDKQQNAAYCLRQLHLSFPGVVDGMDGAVEKAYNAWPSLVVVVGADGRVAYSTRLTELEYRQENLEFALRSALAEPMHTWR